MSRRAHGSRLLATGFGLLASGAPELDAGGG
jgi:hypothetical protein